MKPSKLQLDSKNFWKKQNTHNVVYQGGRGLGFPGKVGYLRMRLDGGFWEGFIE